MPWAGDLRARRDLFEPKCFPVPLSGPFPSLASRNVLRDLRIRLRHGTLSRVSASDDVRRRNCSGHGECTTGVGCHCHSGYFGMDCQLVDDKERFKSLSSELKVRVPLNNRDCGNVVSSSGVDRTLSPCALLGAATPCEATPRPKGRQYLTPDDSMVPSRRSEGTEIVDAGLQFNPFAPSGVSPDFVRQDNLSLPINGHFTVASWVRVASTVSGLWFAAADSVFDANGRCPAFDALVSSVLRSGTAEDLQRRLAEYVGMQVYFAVHLDGLAQQLTVVGKVSADQIILQRFRTSILFDNNWHHLALRMHRLGGTVQADVTIDGVRSSEDGLHACLPNFFVAAPYPPQPHSSNHTSVVEVYAGVSVFWGVALQGSLDELTFFSTAIPITAIQDISGLGNSKAVFRVLFVVTLCAVGCSVVLYAVTLRRALKRSVASPTTCKKRSCRQYY